VGVKCGNCKELHDTVAEVRECHGVAPRLRDEESKIKLNPGKKLPVAASDSSGVSGGSNFTPGSVTRYGTGTIRAAGAAEVDTREPCEWCGLKVASGQAHDC
jgi:hypothetical protein